LESWAEELAAAVREHSIDAGTVLELLLSAHWFERLMSLPTAPTSSFRLRRNGPATIRVEIDAAVADWIRGVGISELARTHLGDVDDEEFRLEQIGGFVTSAFETFLPSVVAILLGWTDEKLAASGQPTLDVATVLASLIRYGADTPQAVELMRAGIVDRELASRIAHAHAESSGQDVRAWLCSLALEEWNDLFRPSVHDLRALVEFARKVGAGTLADVLDGRTATFEVTVSESTLNRTVEVSLFRTDMGSIQVHESGHVVGSVRPDNIADLDALTRAGVPLRGQLVPVDGGAALAISLATLDS